MQITIPNTIALCILRFYLLIALFEVAIALFEVAVALFEVAVALFEVAVALFLSLWQPVVAATSYDTALQDSHIPRHSQMP